jgi:hypothetical protein
MCFEGVVAGATIVVGGDIVEVVVAVVIVVAAIDSVEVIAAVVVVITAVEATAPASVVGVATDGDSVVVGCTAGVGGVGVVNAGVARVFESLWDVDFPAGLKRRFTAMASSSVNVVSSFLMRFPVTGQVQRANTT